MSLDISYIKLFRKMKDWEWYKDNNTKSLFLHCLIEANYQDNEWQGILIKRGSFVTSLFNLSRDLGISIQSLRTSFSKLKKSKNLTYESTNKYSIVTVCNFETYQSDKITKQQASQQTTNKQSTSNQQATNNNIRIEELKNGRIEEKENEIDESISQKSDESICEPEIGKPEKPKKAKKLPDTYEEGFEVFKDWAEKKIKGFKNQPDYQIDIDRITLEYESCYNWMKDNPTRYTSIWSKRMRDWVTDSLKKKITCFKKWDIPTTTAKDIQIEGF